MSDHNKNIARIGTRVSKLARLQTDFVLRALKEAFPQINFEIVPVTTHGDQVRDRPIAELGTRGVFVKELEEALLANEVDLVVHSLKDLPTDLPSGLCLGAVPAREDVRDVIVSRGNTSFSALPAGALVATSSRRRAAQLRSLRKDLNFVDIRGNVDTRLRKLDDGQCDAMVLAAAGLLRLGLGERITEYLDPQISTPAVGQGALGIECRSDDNWIMSMLSHIDNKEVRALTTAERSFLDELGGGCSVPVGALAESVPADRIKLSGCVASLDGTQIFRDSLESSAAQAHELGRQLAERILSQGAGSVLASLKTMTSNMVSPP